jgi:hypothetical protein
VWVKVEGFVTKKILGIVENNYQPFCSVSSQLSFCRRIINSINIRVILYIHLQIDTIFHTTLKKERNLYKNYHSIELSRTYILVCIV